jgi:hypothetical protein
MLLPSPLFADGFFFFVKNIAVLSAETYRVERRWNHAKKMPPRGLFFSFDMPWEKHNLSPARTRSTSKERGQSLCEFDSRMA